MTKLVSPERLSRSFRWLSHSRRDLLLAAGAALFLAGGAAVPALAQTADTYPTKPIRIIVPLAPGGSVDLTARIVAEGLTRVLGQTVLIENQPGGGGTIGAGNAAKAAPDGYTMVMGSSSTFAVNPSLMKNLPYDAIKDFAPVSFISFAPNVLVVPPSLPVNTVGDLVAMAKAKPGALTFASSGTGGSPHLAGELFKREAAVDVVHVPYKSSGQSLTDLLAGRIDMSFSTVITLQEQIRSGALKALAVTTPERVEALPDVPTMAEAGYPGVLITAWNGLLMPAGTPPAIVARVSNAVQQLKNDPKFVAQFKKDGSIFVGSDSAYFANYIEKEIAKWREIVKAANIQVE
jgi:tripartite-type tricarboxylate transporter receptor subunit TctC